jgi:hypothetical protein
LRGIAVDVHDEALGRRRSDQTDDRHDDRSAQFLGGADHPDTDTGLVRAGWRC